VTLYSVYEPRAEAPDLMQRADQLAFVKEGFSWPALLFPPLWLLYHRMWIELVLFILAFAGLGWVLSLGKLGEALLGWVSFALVLLFAIEANDLRRAALERRGYRLSGMAAGRDREAAELTFYRSWLPHQTRIARQPERVSEQPGGSDATAPLSGTEGEEVIGLFPGL
jgi:Protein of unknown function (DUF2628)